MEGKRRMKDMERYRMLEEGAWQRAIRDTRQQLQSGRHGVLVGVIVAAVVGVASSLAVDLPVPATALVAAAIFLLGLAVELVAVFLLALLIAPRKQRNEIREELRHRLEQQQVRRRLADLAERGLQLRTTISATKDQWGQWEFEPWVRAWKEECFALADQLQVMHLFRSPDDRLGRRKNGVARGPSPAEVDMPEITSALGSLQDHVETLRYVMELQDD